MQFEWLNHIQSLREYMNLKAFFKHNISLIDQIIFSFLLFRVFQCSNFKWFIKHLNRGHKGHSIVQKGVWDFISYNPKVFFFHHVTIGLWHTVADFRFGGTVLSADDRWPEMRVKNTHGQVVWLWVWPNSPLPAYTDPWPTREWKVLYLYWDKTRKIW